MVRAAAAVSLGIQIFQRPAIDDVQIQQTVVVIVEPADTAAIDFDHGGFALLSANSDTVEARPGSRVAKPDARSRCFVGAEMQAHRRHENQNRSENKNAGSAPAGSYAHACPGFFTDP